jgi:hypothetical protein
MGINLAPSFFLAPEECDTRPSFQLGAAEAFNAIRKAYDRTRG